MASDQGRHCLLRSVCLPDYLGYIGTVPSFPCVENRFINSHSACSLRFFLVGIGACACVCMFVDAQITLILDLAFLRYSDTDKVFLFRVSSVCGLYQFYYANGLTCVS